VCLGDVSLSVQSDAAMAALENSSVHISPIAAAYAYDEAARKHYGEFARLNFPLTGERSVVAE